MYFCNIEYFTFSFLCFILFMMFSKLIFVVLVALIFNMYIRVNCLIEVFVDFLCSNSMNFLRIVFSIFYCFMFRCLHFLAMLLFLCLFVNIFQVFYLYLTSSNDSDSPSSKLDASVSKRLVLIITKFCVVIETDTEEV